jgi:hypothetical protein
MGRAAVILAIVCTFAFAACDGDAEPDTNSTRIPTAVDVASPTAVPVPERPSTLTEYPGAIAAYLSANPPAGDLCGLDELYAAWDMPLVTAESACRVANTDEDAEGEVLAVVTAESAEPSGAIVYRFTIGVLDRADGGYEVATVLEPPFDVPPLQAEASFAPIIGAGDLNNDGGGEFAFRTTTCGANTCTDTVYVKKGTSSGYEDIAPAEGISLTTAEVTFEDTDGDGAKELVLTGGTAGSAGAGPQRPVTEVWGWDGFAYVRRSSTPAPPRYLYHAVKDADALFDAGNYAPAGEAYLAAIENPELELWMPDTNERNELESYSLFRAALAVLAEGGDAARANGYLDRAEAYPETLHAQLAGAFQAGFEAKSEISVGCSAVRDDLGANAAEYAAFWDFGFANPSFAPNTVCPF